MSLAEVLKKTIVLSVCVFTAGALALEIEKVNFADQQDLGAQKLVLNGAGLRTKRKFGMNFRVYVAGLYVVKRSSDAKAIVASEDPKILRMVFLRGLSRSTLREAMEEGFHNNCKFECEAMKEKLKAFNDLMVDVKEGGEMRLEFFKDSLNVRIDGKESKTGRVDGAAFGKNMLAVFIGDEPPTAEFKSALLGK